MKKQLLTLQQLLAVMDPQLYRHLGSQIYIELIVKLIVITRNC